MSVEVQRMLESAAAAPRGKLDLEHLERRYRRRRAARMTGAGLALVLCALVAGSLLLPMATTRPPTVLLDTAAASDGAWPLEVRGSQFSYEGDGSSLERIWELSGHSWDDVTMVQVASRNLAVDGTVGPLSRRGEVLEERAGVVAVGFVLVRDPHEPFATVREVLAGEWRWRTEDRGVSSPPEQLLGWVDAHVLGHEGRLELEPDPDPDLLQAVVDELGVPVADVVALRSRDGGPTVRGVRHLPSGIPLRVIEVADGTSRPIIEVTHLRLGVETGR